jgi:hypothetical protein
MVRSHLCYPSHSGEVAGAGIEPASLPYESKLVPLQSTPLKLLGRELNPYCIGSRPIVSAKLDYRAIKVGGIEPPTAAPRTRRATTTPHPDDWWESYSRTDPSRPDNPVDARMVVIHFLLGCLLAAGREYR